MSAIQEVRNKTSRLLKKIQSKSKPKKVGPIITWREIRIGTDSQEVGYTPLFNKEATVAFTKILLAMGVS